MATSPTQLTLKKLRAEGYQVEVVERWVPGINIRKDLFGFIDILGVKDGETIAVQSTSDNGGNVAKRVQKIADSENVAAVRKANWTLHVHGWKKVKNRWQCRVVDVS